MIMAGNKLAGDIGEKEVIKHAPCPNCGKKLMGLPANYPLYDVQCIGCSFRAQIKTNNKKALTTKEIFGATWLVMEKVLKSGRRLVRETRSTPTKRYSLDRSYQWASLRCENSYCQEFCHPWQVRLSVTALTIARVPRVLDSSV
jgi:hypothetical protein